MVYDIRGVAELDVWHLPGCVDGAVRQQAFLDSEMSDAQFWSFYEESLDDPESDHSNIKEILFVMKDGSIRHVYHITKQGPERCVAAWDPGAIVTHSLDYQRFGSRQLEVDVAHLGPRLCCDGQDVPHGRVVAHFVPLLRKSRPEATGLLILQLAVYAVSSALIIAIYTLEQSKP